MKVVLCHVALPGALALLIGCGSTSDEDLLTGRWESISYVHAPIGPGSQDPQQTSTLTLRSDHTAAEMLVLSDCSTAFSCQGVRWTSSGSQITFSQEPDCTGSYPPCRPYRLIPAPIQISGGHPYALSADGNTLTLNGVSYARLP